jgi:medium-chain acyl-[acyl-carrier-protein] hydrolase
MPETMPDAQPRQSIVDGSGWLVGIAAAAVRPPRAHLVCFAHAGGGPPAFAGWTSTACDIYAAQLPGRGRRGAEAPTTSVPRIVGEVCAAITRTVAADRRPCVLYGHSLGAYLAFEVARALTGTAIIAGLVVAGARAPRPPHRRPPPDRAGGLDDAAFLRRMRALGGTPDEFFDSPDLIEMVLPTLRADFTIVDEYRCLGGTRLSVPVIAFHGTADPMTTAVSVAGWAAETTGAFRVEPVDGDHFFPVHAHPRIIAAVEELAAVGPHARSGGIVPG